MMANMLVKCLMGEKMQNCQPKSVQQTPRAKGFIESLTEAYE